MSERIPRSTAPEPTAKEAFTESPNWEKNNDKIGELVDKYLGETYVLDGKEYTVWFARPAGSVKSEMYISEFDLMGENGDFIEGIPSKDLAARIDKDSAKNTDAQNEQNDEGGHDTDDRESTTGEQQTQPSQAVLENRRNYIFNQAEWHLNREFTIGDHSYKIDGIYYGGNDDDGIYTTDAVDILDTTTGTVIKQLSIPELEAKIAAEQPLESATEQQQALTERINRELEGFDQKTAFERAEFEAFLYGHPELLEEDSETDKTDDEPQMPPTIDPIETADPAEDPLEQKRRDAIEAFDKLAADNPEYEELRDEFMKDLAVYIEGLATADQSDYELAR